MAKVTRYLHEECSVMHTDLDPRNWIVKKDGELILCDFGSAKILEDGQVIEIGTKAYYKEDQSAPEMALINKKTSQEFSFPGDVWQLGSAFNNILNQGVPSLSTPEAYG